MLKLGVNIDHVATLREARGTEYPSVLEAAAVCEKAGVAGITVHLREDRRHIQDADIFGLREQIQSRMNLEMGNSPEIVAIALDIRPHEVCLVPERREELTTEGGLDVAGNADALSKTVSDMKDRGIVPSMFIDPEPLQIKASADVGAPCIELHTGAYCNVSGDEARRELERLVAGAELAHELGLQVNAGHGLNIHNIESIFVIKHLDTLNIGHSIVARAVFLGLEGAVKEMLELLHGYEGE